MEFSERLPIDHFITISTSDNKLEAYLEFTDVDDNFECTIEELQAILKKHRIIYGVDQQLLHRIAQNPSHYFNNTSVIARGTSPTDGDNGYLHFLIDIEKKARVPIETEDGKVDFKEVNNINNVVKGQLIAERIAAKDGIDGKAVTGETLYSKKGKEARFRVGKNVILNDEQTAMYAAIDGLITKTDREKINVFPIFEINGDVDYKVGNIDFIGTVVVRGNVLSGFRIRAAGDIRVIGGVEGAELYAEGSIEITAGILGFNKGIVKANRNIKTSFIQEGNVEAGENIIVSQSIMHSTIRAGKSVSCIGTKGLIVGGLVQAGELVEARTIGNSMSTSTVIEIGVLPELRNELTELRQQSKELNENLEKTEKALVLLDQLAASGQLSPDKLALKIRLGNTKKQIIDQYTQVKERVLEIEKTLEDTSIAKLKVVSIIYSGTKIVIGRYTKYIKDSNSRVTFKLEDGEISMQPTF